MLPSSGGANLAAVPRPRKGEGVAVDKAPVRLDTAGMADASFYGALRARLLADPERPALELVSGRLVGRGELDRGAGRFATVLRERGARPGDRVAFQVEKSPEALVLYLACLRAGLIAVPMNPAYQAAEVAHILADAEPSIYVGDPRWAETFGQAVPAVLTLDCDGGGSLTEAAASAAEAAPVAAAPSDIAAMLYTSGTTGRPKGAPLSHANLASNARVLVEAWEITARDVLLHALPIFHAHGLFVAAHTALLAGARMLWLARFDAGEVLRLLPRATLMMGVPTFYTRLLDEPGLDREACRSVRLFVSGSAPLLAETWHAFARRTGHQILERYGMSEILMHTGNPLHGERRPGTVGVPFAGSEVRIVDEADQDLPAGAIGQVLVRGPNVFAGYWRRDGRVGEDFVDGWFRTGDLGTLSADGYLTLVGRAKDLVITGGLNVYPSEVEAVVDALPGVLESAVIGLPHRDLGEAVTAVVRAAAGGRPLDEATVIAHCKQRLAGYKVPKRVLFVAELPRNSMGKVQKRLLRETYAELYQGVAR
jgi:malonyl-CoA/methylmalonyl-CoA synthetase